MFDIGCRFKHVARSTRSTSGRKKKVQEWSITVVSRAEPENCFCADRILWIASFSPSSQLTCLNLRPSASIWYGSNPCWCVLQGMNAAHAWMTDVICCASTQVWVCPLVAFAGIVCALAIYINISFSCQSKSKSNRDSKSTSNITRHKSTIYSCILIHHSDKRLLGDCSSTTALHSMRRIVNHVLDI